MQHQKSGPNIIVYGNHNSSYRNPDLSENAIGINIREAARSMSMGHIETESFLRREATVDIGRNVSVPRVVGWKESLRIGKCNLVHCPPGIMIGAGELVLSSHLLM